MRSERIWMDPFVVDGRPVVEIYTFPERIVCNNRRCQLSTRESLQRRRLFSGSGQKAYLLGRKTGLLR